MVTKSIACPSCEVKLKIAATLPVGKKIKCPKCESAFRIPDDDEPIEASPVTPTRKRKASLPPPDEFDDEDEEEVEDRPARKPRKKAKKTKSKAPLFIGLGLGALVLVTGGVLAFVLWPSKTKTTPVAQTSTPTPTPAAGNGQPTTPPTAGTTPPAPSAPGDAPSAASGGGRKIFDNHNCGRCHGIDAGGGGSGKGKKNGPDLSRVGENRNADWIMEHIRDPKSHRPNSRMPAYDASKIPQQDLRALGEFLASLK